MQLDCLWLYIMGTVAVRLAVSSPMINCAVMNGGSGDGVCRFNIQ